MWDRRSNKQLGSERMRIMCYDLLFSGIAQQANIRHAPLGLRSKFTVLKLIFIFSSFAPDVLNLACESKETNEFCRMSVQKVIQWSLKSCATDSTNGKEEMMYYQAIAKHNRWDGIFNKALSDSELVTLLLAHISSLPQHDGESMYA